MTKSLNKIMQQLKLISPDSYQDAINKVLSQKEILISGVENDSRRVKNGTIFVAIKGYQSDGHDFIDSAIQNGASCLFVEEEQYNRNQKYSVPIVSVKNTRKVLAFLSKIFYDDPTKKLKLIGITGTNGKTTITYMLREILRESGEKVGLIGTICNYIGDKRIKSPITTPDTIELNRLFQQMLYEGVTYVVMEVSSHALYLDRVTGLDFDCVVFTNLSEDHLDFHKDMEEYLAVKKLILNILAQSGKKETLAVLNNDLDFSHDLITRSQKLDLNYVTYGLNDDSDYQAKNINFTFSHSKFSIQNGHGNAFIEIPLPGRFNVYNTLASVAVARFFDINHSNIESGLKRASIPGRFQVVQTPIKAYIIIDYAHTDDAIRNVLSTIRELNPNRIISVFGCGGDRDKGKRPLMGEVSGEMSDLTIVTSDNTRTEEPNQILDDIITGVNKVKGAYLKIENRYSAIQKAIELSQEGDAILIAGKGHEDYQILKGKTIHFDDKEVVEEILRGVYGRIIT